MTDLINGNGSAGFGEHLVSVLKRWWVSELAGAKVDHAEIEARRRVQILRTGDIARYA
jgi:hypothetical protein